MLEKRDPQTFAVIGAAIEVDNELGCGFLEAVYQEALAIEFDVRDIPFKREVPLDFEYKSTPLSIGYRIDFLCYGEIIVELKAVQRITAVEEAQVINYLKGSPFERALLINFGETSLRHKRFINQQSVKSA